MKHATSKSQHKIIAGFLLIIILGAAVYLVRYLQSRSTVRPNSSSSTTIPVDGGINGNVLHPCSYNKIDQCKSSPSIDFFPTGSEDAVNPQLEASGAHKEIMGVITAIDTSTIRLKTTSGRIFNVGFPIDAAENFNVNRSPYYNNIKVILGDTLYVGYFEPVQLEETIIKPSQVERSSLLIKDTNPKLNPSAPIEKY